MTEYGPIPEHWDTDKLISHAKAADHIADNCRPDNRHMIGFREQAFRARKRARESLADNRRNTS